MRGLDRRNRSPSDFWTTIKFVLDISFAASSDLLVSAGASSEAAVAGASSDFAFLFLACFFFTLNSQSNFLSLLRMLAKHAPNRLYAERELQEGLLLLRLL